MADFFDISFWQNPIEIGNLRFTLLSLVTGVVLFLILGFASRLVKRMLSARVLPGMGLSPGVSAAVATLISYGVLFLGILVIMPVMIQGFNLDTLIVVFGALSFGIGFGLRNVADNFISGVIILIERPIKLGDRIEVENVFGTVVGIHARSTTVRTNDNIDIIIPNSQLISEQVTNLSHEDKRVRYHVSVGVHYESEPRLVERALLEAAGNCPNVLQRPSPLVRFSEFGDSSLNFDLAVWTESLQDRPKVLISEVNFAIWTKFQEYDIRIPYPQRDIYVKELQPSLTVQAASEGSSK